jgi:hypothetical protein
MYGKLKNGKLTVAPRSVVVGDKRIINPDGETLLSLGWLPVDMTEAPGTEEGFAVSSHYEEQDGRIVRVWTVEQEPEREPTPEERIAALEAAVLEMILGGEQHD